eukprot:TRINITY_DN34796_c0_g1_i1.p1 TRINITY_DN34796_c0_g1~~TRINITY_DN34796_c0_g1_i1.p1  ORF type:complete len:231 (-),score=38.23 TRINITY_DN34796_c0_g1_i1:27-719(-)
MQLFSCLLYLLVTAGSVHGDGECLTTAGKMCVFPFRYQHVDYTACTWRDGHRTQGVPWCSLKVTGAGDHVNSKDGRGSTWDYCSGDCYTSHLECSPVNTECSNSSILQRCVESKMTTGEEVATWCVLMRDNQEKTIHVKCPEDCNSYTQEDSQLWAHGEGVLGLCADSGPECIIFGGVCVLLLITTLVTVCVAMVCVRRQRQQGQDMRIRSASINPGDRYRKSMAGALDG